MRQAFLGVLCTFRITRSTVSTFVEAKISNTSQYAEATCNMVSFKEPSEPDNPSQPLPSNEPPPFPHTKHTHARARAQAHARKL